MDTGHEHKFKFLTEKLVEICTETGGKTAFLVNLAGQVLAGSNPYDEGDLTLTGILIASGMATALALADAHNDAPVSTLHYYEGEQIDTYAALVNSNVIICLIRDNQKAYKPLGAVWLQLKRAIEDMRSNLNDLPTNREPQSPIGDPTTTEDQFVSPINPQSIHRKDKKTIIENSYSEADTRPGSRLLNLEQAQAMGLIDRSTNTKPSTR